MSRRTTTATGPQFAFVGKTTEIPEGIATSSSSSRKQEEVSHAPMIADTSTAPDGWSQEDVDITRWTTQHVAAWLEVIQASSPTCEQFEEQSVVGLDLIGFTMKDLTSDSGASEKEKKNKNLSLTTAEAQLILAERQLLIALAPAIPTSVTDPSSTATAVVGGNQVNHQVVDGRTEGGSSSSSSGGGGGVMFTLNDRGMMHTDGGLKELQAALNKEQQTRFIRAQAQVSSSSNIGCNGDLFEVAAQHYDSVSGEASTSSSSAAIEGAVPAAAAAHGGDEEPVLTDQQRRQHEATKQQLSDFFNAVQMQMEGTTAQQEGEGSDEEEEDDTGVDADEYKEVVAAIAREQAETEKRRHEEKIKGDEFDF